jgi:P4 family phage/plasmid primase-like protien
LSSETDPLVIDIPDTLRALPLWFNWTWKERTDNGVRKRFKMPVQLTGVAASSIDRSTWTTYDRAARAATKFDGLAIGFGHWGTPPDDYCIAGIDLDGCMVEGGGLKDWAAEVLARVDSYAEFSPSGRGIHILVKVGPEYLAGVKINLTETEHIEFYSTARYFTFTGNHVPGTPDDLQSRDAVYKALRSEYEARRPSSQRSRSLRSATKPATAAKDAEQRVSLTSAEIVQKASSGPSGESFARLWAGDLSDYRDDHSSADMALAGRLAFWTGKDPEQMDELFRESGLMRPKWDTRRGLSTYGEQTIEVAIDNCEEVYSGGDRSSESFVEKLKAKRAAKVAATQVVGDTVKAGRVKEQERGEDKTSHGLRVLPPEPGHEDEYEKRILPNGDVRWKYIADDIKRSPKLSPLGSRVVHENESPVSAGLFGSGAGHAVQAALDEGGNDAAKAAPKHVGIPPAPTTEQAGLFNVNGQAARKNVHPKETAPLPADDEAYARLEAEYAAHPRVELTQADVDGVLWPVVEPSEDDEEQPSLAAADPARMAALMQMNEAKLTREARLKPKRTQPDLHFSLDDIGNGRRFESRYSDALMWTETRGWVVFDHKRWAKGTQYAERAAEETVESILNELQDPVLTDEERKQYLRHAHTSASTSSISSMMKRASVQPKIYMEEAAFDANPFLLNVQNGTLNLMTGELAPHDPRDMMTKIAACDYDPDARSDKWERFLEEATRGQDGLLEFLERAAGYTLTGDTREDKIFVLHGVGGTGKSTFVGSLRAMMGDYGRTMRAETITEKAGGGHNEDVAVLAGSRMVLAIETDESSHMREGLIKSLSGGDEITASRKNKPVFQFYPQLKLWLATNNMPKLRSDDSGSWRRVLKASFTHVPDRPDPTLRDTLRQPKHQRAILAWAVRGAQRWWADAARGTPLRVPESVREATELMRRSMDGQAEFFATYLMFGGAKTFTPIADIMAAYNSYAEQAGVHPRYRLGMYSMNRALQNQGAVATRAYVGGKQVRGFSGVVLEQGEF